RGSKAISMSNNASVLVEKQGMTRAPVFICKNSLQAYQLAQWIQHNKEKIREYLDNNSKSQHLDYLGCQTFIRGNYLYVRLNFDTQEAMGMNMVTIASQILSEYLE